MFTSFMRHAYNQALLAGQQNEVPIGCVIVHKHKIIGQGYNLTRTHNDPTAHAEMIALRMAARHLSNYRLDECDLYVTLEPCTMCAGAISHARIRRLYYAAADEKGGAVDSGVRFFNASTCHHKPDIYTGLLEHECGDLLKDFFVKKRL